ncbi:MAG: SIS domain-containing protein [Draconibacterium sp.]|nr:SIS domain-containing protein [Draconibacterium sp.]
MENKFLQLLTQRYGQLSKLEAEIEIASQFIINSYKNGGKLLICGNGGSASDSDHLVGELMKSFELKRPLENELKKKLEKISNERGRFLSDNLQQGLPAISLVAHTSLNTAVTNDICSDVIFAQQVIGYGNQNDVLIGITTSGNSQNVIDALIVARAKGLKTIGFTGESGGKMKEFCDILINVPEKRTAFVQELHLPVFHTICLIVEHHFFGHNS